MLKVSLDDTFMIRNTRLGGRELQLLFELEQRKDFIFTFQDAKKILGTSDASVKNVLKRLKKKNRVIRLHRGVYLFAPMKSGPKGHWSEHAFALVPFLVKTKDYYVSFVTAMNYWGMTEQIPRTVYVVLRRQKKPLEAQSSKFIFVKKPRLGEYEKFNVSGAEVNLASREQTIIDALLFPQYSLGIEEVTKAIVYSQKELNWTKLIFLAKEEKKVVQQRLGYVLDLLKLSKYSKKLKGNFADFAWLDPSYAKKVLTRDKKWGLKINKREKDILDFMEVH